MRFTPAHAGNTHVNAEEAGSLEVHPRSRGEYLLTLHQTDPEPGSSPLTRGIPEVCGADCTRCRFIPAHAGNTKFDGCMPPFPKVHPRSRGEYCSPAINSWSITGSSPLTRGILHIIRYCSQPARFIPAHAGNT